MKLNLQELFKHVNDPRDLAAGETIIAAGTRGATMYVVLEGKVEIRAGDRLLDVAGPGGIVGEVALIDASVRSASAIAKNDCRLAPVDRQQFLYMVQQSRMALTQAPTFMNGHGITRKTPMLFAIIPCFSLCFRGQLQVCRSATR